MSNSNQAVRIIYKDHDSGREFFVYANPGMAEKYRKDKTIPLVEVLQSDKVFDVDQGGNTGQASSPPNSTLENTFGTKDRWSIAQRIVEEGDIKGIHWSAHGGILQKEQKGAFGKGGLKQGDVHDTNFLR
ncbi:uncharacterized protein VTP21DRAFT_10738 [Calcarisporiella thermophila]|uniref:uncharacterized protein n=1 Tax=Calcarisporiella thermophila TaxID=911321 RepID=UPI003743B270